MPLATGSTTEKFELKSLPGGFVVIRRMTYGEKLARQSLLSGFKVRAGKNKDFEGELQIANRKVTEYEFRVCVQAHNLEKDEQGTLLDLASPNDLVMLDGKVGEEIGVYIDRVNQFSEEDDELGNSSIGSELP